MHRILKLILVSSVLVLLPAPPVAADDETGSAAMRFAATLDKWKQLNKEMEGLVGEFSNASEDRQDELRKEFEKLQARAFELQPKLRETGLAAYQEAPNKNKELTDVLMGLAAYEIHSDRYASAKEITDLLLRHNCEEKGLHELAGVVAYAHHDFDAAGKLFKKSDEAGLLSRNGKIYLAEIDTTKKNWESEKAIRKKEATANDLPRVKLETSKGDIVLELYEDQAPQAVANFISLVEKKFYHGLKFHRVLPGFMAQGGCPNGTGGGGPGYKIYCETERDDHRKHFTGTLSMAHAGKNTGGSQFFLTFRPTPHLDGRHTAFGRVIEGMDVLVELERVDPDRPGGKPDKILKATVVRKRDHEYKPTKVK